MSTLERQTGRKRTRDIFYPVRDGKPLGETGRHVQETLNCIQSLQYWYQHREDVYVIGNSFVYWNEGVPRDRVAPDCYVIFGVDKRLRDSVKTWEEGGHLPSVVFEFTSPSTRKEDFENKFTLYEQVWKAKEYFLFDPKGDYLTPRLQGYRLIDGRYVRLEMTDSRLYSEQLDLDLVMEGEHMRFYDPSKGEFLPTLAEAAAQTQSAVLREQEARQRAEIESQRAGNLETVNARLLAELEVLRREMQSEKQ